jgi:hypothetical protein
LVNASAAGNTEVQQATPDAESNSSKNIRDIQMKVNLTGDVAENISDYRDRIMAQDPREFHCCFHFFFAKMISIKSYTKTTSCFFY